MDKCDKKIDKLPECQCSGAGHCPLLGVHMDQVSYENCKYDPAWRQDYISFYGHINSKEFTKQLEKTHPYREWQKELHYMKDKYDFTQEATAKHWMEVNNAKKEYDEQQLKLIHELNEAGVTEETYKTNTGLGDTIGNVLSKLGITEEAVESWLGQEGGCGCDKRQKFLNKILPFRKRKE